MAQVFKDRVKETTDTTGTGVLTLSGAVTGFRSFSPACSVGSTFRYALHGVNSNGSPTDEWEVGIGTLLSASTMERTTVLASSAADTAVNLSVGTKHVWIGMDAAQGSWIREMLSAPKTYYVATSGSDATGTGSVANPFASVARAFEEISKLHTNGQPVTINVGSGTYSGVIQIDEAHFDHVLIVGQGPASTIFENSYGCVLLRARTTVEIWNATLRVQGAEESFILAEAQKGDLLLYNVALSIPSIPVDSTVNVLYANDHGKIIYNGASSSVSVAGEVAAFLLARHHGAIFSYSPVAISVGMSVTDAFAVAEKHGLIEVDNPSFAGTVTGPRYRAALCGVIVSNGAVFPGSTPGSTATGGQYV